MAAVVQSLAESMAERGHEVEVVAVTAFGDPRPGQKRRASVKRAWSFAPVGSQELAPAYIAAAWWRADVIHLHHPHSLADITYALRPSLAPLVVTQHADYPTIKYKLPGRYVLKRAAAIIVPSRAHIARSRELKGFEHKVHVIPCGIDERRWEVVPPPLQQPAARVHGRLEGYRESIPPRASNSFRAQARHLAPVRNGTVSRPSLARWPSPIASNGGANIPMRTSPAEWPTQISWCSRR